MLSTAFCKARCSLQEVLCRKSGMILFHTARMGAALLDEDGRSSTLHMDSEESSIADPTPKAMISESATNSNHEPNPDHVTLA